MIACLPRCIRDDFIPQLVSLRRLKQLTVPYVMHQQLSQLDEHVKADHADLQRHKPPCAQFPHQLQLTVTQTVKLKCSLVHSSIARGL